MIKSNNAGQHDLRPFIDPHGHLRIRVQFGFDPDDYTGISSTPAEVARYLRDLADLTAALAEPAQPGREEILRAASRPDATDEEANRAVDLVQGTRTRTPRWPAPGSWPPRADIPPSSDQSERAALYTDAELAAIREELDAAGIERTPSGSFTLPEQDAGETPAVFLGTGPDGSEEWLIPAQDPSDRSEDQ